MYKNKYLKYKNKYINLKKLIGGTVPTCIKEHHDNTFKDLKTIILLPGTYLLHGNSLFNELQVLPSRTFADGTKLIKFFNTTFDSCVQYAFENRLNLSDPGYIGLYQVIEPIQIYGQLPKTGPFYYQKGEYNAKDIQCLCDDGYNGYCSYWKNSVKNIADIGLCNYNDKIKLVGYAKVENKDQENARILNVYKHNEGNSGPNTDETNRLLISDASVTLENINRLNRPNIDTIYEQMVDITE